MGNKQGKLEKTDSKKNKNKNRNSKNENDQNKSPDVGDGSATSPFPRTYRGDSRPGMRVFHSYSGAGNGSKSLQRPASAQVDTSLYRRSGASTPTGGRYRSLPRTTVNGRTMGRSRSVTSSIYLSNGSLNHDTLSDQVPSHRYSIMPAIRTSGTGGGTGGGGGGYGLNDTRDSIRSTSTYASNTYASNTYASNRHPGTNYRVVSDHFPDTNAIKRRINQFETTFAKVFVAFYSRLPETLQLSAISIALRHGPTGQHPISLYQYLTSEEIPTDLAAAQSGRSPLQEQYILTIPQALFPGVKHVRSERIPDRRHWVSLARELVNCLAVEVAEEITRIFEYQIVLLGDGLPIDLLARHGAESAIDYLKMGNRFLDRNTMINGVLHGGTRTPDPSAAKIISVVIGEREFKWNLGQIFQRCGLRKETLLLYARTQDANQQTPWNFYTSQDCNPLVYGYRGLVLDRDPVHGYYLVSREDENRFTQEVEWNPEDVHRRYVPYRRLIGKEVMDEFCAVTKDNENSTLADYVLKLQGFDYSRDTIQPIYRPLGMVSQMPNRSRMASSTSSLLSHESGTNRTLVRRPDGSVSRMNPNVKQVHVTSTVVLRNTSTPTPQSGSMYNGYIPSYQQPPPRKFSPDTHSLSGDGTYGRAVPSAFGAPKFRNSSTFVRPEPLQHGRLYQSQRHPPHPRSVSSFDHPPPGPVAREISAPAPTGTSDDFINFNAFLGMIKHRESQLKSDEANGNVGSPPPSGLVTPTTNEVFTFQMNGHSPRQANGMTGKFQGMHENDLRRTAISHV